MSTSKQLFAAALLSVAAAGAFAQEGPATVFTDTPSTASRAEVIADLHLWQRAGVDKFVGVEGPAPGDAAYQRALATYQRLRSGPEYLAEVQRVAEKRHERVATIRTTPSQN